MNTSLAIRLFPETLRSLAFGSILAGYVGIGSSFAHPIRIIFIQNLTDVLLLFSFDGVNDHFPLPSNGFLLLDVTSNKSVSMGCFIAQGTRLYVKRSGVPSSGAVYVSAFYAQDSL